MKLWHCHNARSLRPLWALEEMGLEYELELMPFPPRVLHEGYKEKPQRLNLADIGIIGK